jgi:YVTN family beta-propeller protein
MNKLILILTSAIRLAVSGPDSCATNSANRQLDYWLGDWTIGSGGSPGNAHSTVTLSLDKCLVVENWDGGRGHNGENVFGYSADDKSWYGMFADNEGRVHVFTSGKVASGTAEFEGSSRGPNGERVLNRVKVMRLDPNKVEQTWEKSTDNGAHWNVVFRGEYSRANLAPDSALLILANEDNTLRIVNPANLKVTATLPVGPDPHEVITSPDGTTAYISNYGGGAYNTLTVVDLVAKKVLPAIDLGPLRGPHGLTFVGGRVWFTAEAARAIGSYDPATRKVDWIMGTGQNRTHMIYVSPDLNQIVTTNVSSASVSIMERIGTGTWTETIVPVGSGSEGFDVSPDGKEIWVANADDGTVSIIDAASKKVIATLAANVAGANRLKFTRDGKLVFISSLNKPDVVVLDRVTRKEVKRIKVGDGAAGILMQPDGARVYVACSPDGYVAVIDLHSLEVVGRIEGGQGPDGLAWDGH